MPNANPIQVIQPAIQTRFEIPSVYVNTQLSLTIKIDITAAGWNYLNDNEVFFDSNDIYPSGTPEPVNLPIGSGAELDGKELMLSTKVTLIYPSGGNTGNPPVFQYLFSINAGDTNISTFLMPSLSDYVTNFNSLVLFEQL